MRTRAMEGILSNSKCEILHISSRNKGFSTLQIFVVEWWSGLDGNKIMSHDNGWGE